MLDRFRIASPCSANWELMQGDDKVRFCGDCQKNVYNLSSMSRTDAEKLLSSGQSICGRFYRRVDGTVLTEDCPVGLRAKAARVRQRVSFAISGWIGVAAAFAQTPQVPDRLVQIEQNARFEIKGVVKDASGYLFPGVLITLVDEKSGSTFVIRSVSGGEFRVEAPRGIYTLRAQATGFKTFQKEHMALEADTRIDFTIDIAAMMGEVVEVRKPSLLHKLRRLL
jgi:Carboxypeptidase regulatory-like domain